MLEENEKKLVYFAIAVIILLLIIALIFIWMPMFSSNEKEVGISTISNYEDGYYVNKMKEEYKSIVSSCVNVDNFDSTFEMLNDEYVTQLGMEKDKIKEYLSNKGVLTYPTSTAVIYCSSLRTNNQRYIYTYVYKVGNTERKVHVIEEYYGDYTISFDQDSYPVLDAKEYVINDKATGLEFKVKELKSYDENIVMDVTIVNNTTEEFLFNFSAVDDSNLIYSFEQSNKNAFLSSIIVGSEISEVKSIPGSTEKIKLTYGINLENQEKISHICFKNITRLNGEKINIEMIIK